MSLPAADDLFRPTAPDVPGSTQPPEQDDVEDTAAEPSGQRVPSGRVRHDEKMTVYVTADELLDLEHARLTLRRDHGVAVDRGRLVRAAIAIALADLESQGDESVIVQRLQQS